MRRSIPFVLGLAVLITACSDQQEPEPEVSRFDNTLMGYVPADTPYYFVGGEDTPQEVIDKMERMYSEVWGAIAEEAMADYQDAMSEVPDGEGGEDYKALVRDVVERVEADGLAAFGVDYTDDLVFYGEGLLPVLRINMSYPDNFRGMVELFEGHIGEQLPVATHAGNEFWRFDTDDMLVMFGLSGNMFVASIAPPERESAMLDHLFGAPDPANALSGDTVLAVADRYGFTTHAIGRVDIVGLARRLMAMDPSDPMHGIIGEETDLDPACREEILGFLSNSPSAVFGYTALTPNEFSGSLVVELEPTLAQDLSGLAVALPGMGAESDAPAAFGMAMDLAGASKMARDWLLDAANRDFACEGLANVDYAGNAQQVNPAALGMMGNPRGFFVRLDNRNIDWIEDEDFSEASITLSALFENPSTVMYMAQTFIPPLQQMDIKPDGEMFQLDVEQMMAATGEEMPPEMQGKMPDVWGVMTETMLAVASGPDSEQRLRQIINATAQADPPVIYYQIDMPWIMELGARQMSKELDELRAQLPLTEFNAELFASIEEQEAAIQFQIEELEQQIEFSKVYGELMGNTEFAIRFTADGIRMDSTTMMP